MTNQKRRPHFLRGTKRTTVPGQIIVFDTETLPFCKGKKDNETHHKLRLGTAMYARIENGKPTREEYIWFDAHEQFWDYVDQKLNQSRSLWIFAHSLGFDLSTTRFWEMMESGRYDIEQWDYDVNDDKFPHKGEVPMWRGLAVLEDPPTILVVRKGKKEIVLVDTLNYWKCPLKDLGLKFSLPKMAMPEWTAPDNEWIAYCRRDTEILYKQVLSLISEWHNGQYGKLRFTAAGLAMEAYKTRFMHDKILVHCNGPVTDLEREAYYPGECVAYRRGVIRENVYHLDVNSLYASVMSDNAYPAQLHKYYSCISLDELAIELNDYEAIARVGIVCPPPGIITRIGWQAQRCYGDFVTHLAGPELRMALDSGIVKWVGLCATYKCVDMFTDWVGHMWSRRNVAKKTKDDVGDKFYKTLLNSLTGKWAQKSPRWTKLDGVPAPRAFGNFTLTENGGKRITNCRATNYAVEAESVPGESIDAIPGISAFITAYARERMQQLMYRAGLENVYYQDTDSLIVNMQGWRSLCGFGEISDNELGKLKLVQMASECEIIGPKHYRLDSKWTIAGVKKNAKRNTDGSYDQEEFERLESVLDRQLDGTVIVRWVNVKPGSLVPKDRYREDGWIMPLQLPLQQRP